MNLLDPKEVIGKTLREAVTIVKYCRNLEFRVIKDGELSPLTADYNKDRITLYVNESNTVYNAEIG